MLKHHLAVVWLMLGIWGCKSSFHVGTNKPDGALLGGQNGNSDAGTGGGSSSIPGMGGVSTGASSGSSGIGGAGGVLSPDAQGPVKDASGSPVDAPAPAPEVPFSSADAPVASICLLPKDVGMCDGVCRAYWYNQASGHCEEFTWGCCGGNANNFETLDACLRTCGSGSATDAAALDGRATDATGSSLGMICTTDQDCPSDSRCCDGSDPNCDGTRLPSGDRANPGELVVSADGLSVTDTITGLTWQRDGSGARPGCTGEGNLRCTWNQAQAYCEALELGGQTDWRLPTWKELFTITDLTADPYERAGAIDPIAFPSTPNESFWASTWKRSVPMYVDFWNATVGYNAEAILRVRCVRGSRCYPKTRFVVLDTGEEADGKLVRDTLTGLVWQQLSKRPPPTCRIWKDAQAYCSSWGRGFRLPTLKEMHTLLTPGLLTDETMFPLTDCRCAWTSSPYGGPDPVVTGQVRVRDEMDTYNWSPLSRFWGVRCVR